MKGTGGCDIFLKTNLGVSGTIISLLKSSSISTSVSCSISSNFRNDILFRQFRLPECFPDFLICTRGLLTFWIVRNNFLNIFDIDVHIYQYIEKSWIYFLYSCMYPSNIFNFTKQKLSIYFVRWMVVSNLQTFYLISVYVSIYKSIYLSNHLSLFMIFLYFFLYLLTCPIFLEFYGSIHIMLSLYICLNIMYIYIKYMHYSRTHTTSPVKCVGQRY